MSGFVWRVVGEVPCPKCGGTRERRQLHRPTSEGEQPVGQGIVADCVCEVEILAAAERMRDEKIRRDNAAAAVARAMERSEIGSYFLERTLEKYVVVDGNRAGYELAERCARRIIMRATNHRTTFPTGAKGAGFYGPMGTGKSHLSAGIVNACIAAGVWGAFATSATIVEDMMGDRSGECRKRYGNAPVLVIDDLGRESASKTSVRKLLDVVNLRRENRLPTIVNSNRTPNELIAQYNPLGDDISAIIVRLRELTEWPWTAVTQRVDLTSVA